MTATNNTLTPAGIRHHVYELILLVVLLGLFTGGYVFWQKSMSETSQSLASDYHLNSRSHYLQAMLQLRHMQGHGLLELLEKSTDSNLQKIIQHIQHEYHDTATFYLVRDELNAALALQEEFADSRFDSLTDKLQQQLFIFTEGDSDYFPSDNAAMGQIYSSVSDMLQTLNQLVQLHAVVREDLLAELKARKSRQNAVYIGLLFLLLVLGFSIIRRGLRAIDSVIIDHNRVEKALFDSEKHYRNLVETTAAVAFEIDLRCVLPTSVHKSKILAVSRQNTGLISIFGQNLFFLMTGRRQSLIASLKRKKAGIMHLTTACLDRMARLSGYVMW